MRGVHEGAVAAGTDRVDQYDYVLPEDRIAQHPLETRDASKLLVVRAETFEDRMFSEFPTLLRRGDVVVINDTRVRAARLVGHRATGGEVEVLVLTPVDSTAFRCLTRPGKRVAVGETVTFGEGLTATMESASDEAGVRVVRFHAAGADVTAAVEAHGRMPVPPYIHEPLVDRNRYQTTYASGVPTSAAAPTAGLHFTAHTLSTLRRRGVEVVRIQLEVGLGTFAPMRSERVGDHLMHHETYHVSAEAADAIEFTRASGGRVIAIGTTVVRTLESVAQAQGRVAAASGETSLFIRPGFEFRVVDGLLTNFHQPRSTLLVLMSAFLGERWRDVYAHTLGREYRFLSFGDSMFSWRLA